MFLEKKGDRWIMQTFHKGGRMVETTLAYTVEKVWVKAGGHLIAVYGGRIWLSDLDVREIRYVVSGLGLEMEVIWDGIW